MTKPPCVVHGGLRARTGIGSDGAVVRPGRAFAAPGRAPPGPSLCPVDPPGRGCVPTGPPLRGRAATSSSGVCVRGWNGCGGCCSARPPPWIVDRCYPERRCSHGSCNRKILLAIPNDRRFFSRPDPDAGARALEAGPLALRGLAWTCEVTPHERNNRAFFSSEAIYRFVPTSRPLCEAAAPAQLGRYPVISFARRVGPALSGSAWSPGGRRVRADASERLLGEIP